MGYYGGAARGTNRRRDDDNAGYASFGSDDGIGDYYRDVKEARKRARLASGAPASGKRFYAVAHGRQMGVFSTWDAARKHVDGFSRALYKGFRTRDQADRWLRENENDSP